MIAKSPGFAEMTDAEIASHYGWEVGDEKEIVLTGGTIDSCSFSGGTYNATIIGFNHNKDIEGCGIQMCITSESLPFIICNVRMNESDINTGGWKDSKMRTVYLEQFRQLLPSDLRKRIRPTVKFSDNTGGSSEEYEDRISSTQDFLFLMSEYEYFGSTNQSNPYEASKQQRYQYMVSKGSLGNSNRWLRSAGIKTSYAPGGFCVAGWHNDECQLCKFFIPRFTPFWEKSHIWLYNLTFSTF